MLLTNGCNKLITRIVGSHGPHRICYGMLHSRYTGEKSDETPLTNCLCSTRLFIIDGYGLIALHTLAHVLRLQHDHTGHVSLWGDLAAVVREDFEKHSQFGDTDSIVAGSPAKTLFIRSDIEAINGIGSPLRSNSLGSPEIGRLVLRSGSGLLTKTNSSEFDEVCSMRSSPQKSSVGMRKSLQSPPNYGFSTPKKRSSSPSKARHSNRKCSSASARKLEKQFREHQQRIAELRQRRQREGDLHSDFGRGMYNMAGLRFSEGTIEALISLLTTPAPFQVEAHSFVVEKQITPPNIRKLRHRLVQLCEKLQTVAFCKDHTGDSSGEEDEGSFNLRILRPGLKYCNVLSGETQMALNERTVILFSGPPGGRKEGTSDLPTGYLVEDVLSTLLKSNPSISTLLAENRRRRARWYKFLKVGRSAIKKDMLVSRHSPSFYDIHRNASASPLNSVDDAFSLMLSTYSSGLTWSCDRASHDCSPCEEGQSLRSPIFLRKMK